MAEPEKQRMLADLIHCGDECDTFLTSEYRKMSDDELKEFTTNLSTFYMNCLLAGDRFEQRLALLAMTKFGEIVKGLLC